MLFKDIVNQLRTQPPPTPVQQQAPPAPADPRVLIAQIYNQYPGRAPQTGEMAYWLRDPNLNAAMLANGCEQLLHADAAERAAMIQTGLPCGRTDAQPPANRQVEFANRRRFLVL